MTSRFYLYAIVAGVEPPPWSAGLCGATVTLLPYRNLAAVVSQIGSEDVRSEPAQLLCHERVVEALMAQRSTLPVRFGTVLSDAKAVIATLVERYSVFRADLERLDGQIEMGLRIVWDTETVRQKLTVPQPAAVPEALARTAVSDDARPGTRYLLERAREVMIERELRAEAQALEGWCLERFATLTSENVTRLLATPAMPVSAAFLAPQCKLDAFLAVGAQMQRERPELDLVCTGPWPPYSFVRK